RSISHAAGSAIKWPKLARSNAKEASAAPISMHRAMPGSRASGDRSGRSYEQRVDLAPEPVLESRGGGADPLAERRVVLERGERLRRRDRVARPVADHAEQVLGRRLVAQQREREISDAVALRRQPAVAPRDQRLERARVPRAAEGDRRDLRALV